MMLNCNNELSSFRNFITEFSRKILILFFWVHIPDSILRSVKIDRIVVFGRLNSPLLVSVSSVFVRDAVMHIRLLRILNCQIMHAIPTIRDVLIPVQSGQINYYSICLEKSCTSYRSSNFGPSRAN
jgi:hypothetical protein